LTTAALTTTTVATGTTPSGFDLGGGSIRIYYVAGGDGAIHALDYDPGHGWNVTGALTGAVAPGTSPSAFSLGDNVQRVYYVSAADGAIHALDWDPGLGFNTTGALTPPVARDSSPIAFADGSAGAQRVYFVSAADDAVHELAFSEPGGFTVSGALSAPVASGAPLSGFVLGDGVRVYFVARGDDEVHQLADDPSTGWSQSTAMSAPVMSGSGVSGVATGGCDQQIVFVSAADSTVHALTYSGRAHSDCVSDIVAPAVASAPPTSASPPLASAPVTLVPVTRPGRVHVRILIRWRWRGVLTWLRRLRFSGLGSRAAITVTCAGRGCPRRRWSAPARRARTLERTLANQVFRAGDRLTITISAPRLAAERARLRIRRARKPAAALLSASR
jgi:hypothetical protein